MEIASATDVVNERLQELKDLAWYLDNRSRWNIVGASLSKVVLVLLGSLSAAKAAADQLLGAASTGDIVLFAGVGVLSAVVAGVMAAFQFEPVRQRSPSLRLRPILHGAEQTHFSFRALPPPMFSTSRTRA